MRQRQTHFFPEQEQFQYLALALQLSEIGLGLGLETVVPYSLVDSIPYRIDTCTSMTQARRTSPAPPAFLFGMLLALGIFFLLSLYLIQRDAQLTREKIERIPATITLLTDSGIHHATPAATLITTASLQAYVPPRTWTEITIARLGFALETRITPFDPTLVTAWIMSLSPHHERPAVEPHIILNGKVPQIIPGQRGTKVDIAASRNALLQLDIRATSSGVLHLIPTGRELLPDDILVSEQRARSLLGKALTLKSSHYSRTIRDQELMVLLQLPSGYSEPAISDLAAIIDTQISRSPIEPSLIIEAGRVEEFRAPKDGVNLDREAFARAVQTQLSSLEAGTKPTPLPLPLISTPPSRSLAEMNTLGITERLGLGESAYAHSIPNRIHNVSHTTERIHAKLILPGEEFSFNKYLGDVSAATGFKQAYIIKEGQTILGDGGGVCQVSSTLFRALLNAGLPITERKGHSYRVGYYEQNSRPGFDATVYDPHPDLRFVNDTDTAILINAVADPKTTSMYVELWGKADGRKAEVKNYKQWGAQPAPPPRYQDDPTLKPGQVKQVEYAAPGLKTSFDYVVTYPDGKVQTKTFSTSYIPWAAVYLRGI